MFAAGPVGNAHDPSTWEMETDIRFWVSLGYVWSSRPVWAVPDSVSESKTRWLVERGSQGPTLPEGLQIVNGCQVRYVSFILTGHWMGDSGV